MNEITEKFHTATQNKYPFVKIFAVKIVVNEGKPIVVVHYDKPHSDEYRTARNEIIAGIKLLLPPTAHLEIEEVAVSCDAESIQKAVYSFFKRANAFLMYAVKKEMILIMTGERTQIKFLLPQSVLTYFLRGNYREKIVEYLSDYFFCIFEIALEGTEESYSDIHDSLNYTIVAPRYKYEREGEGRQIRPLFREKFVGELIDANPAYICDATSPENYAVLCGDVVDYKKREFTSKKDGSKKRFASFTLTDVTASIKCVYFPRNGDTSKVEKLYEGAFIIVAGRTEYDEYLGDGSLQMNIMRITFAQMPSDFVINNIVRLPNDDYVHVRPKKLQFAGQFSLQEPERGLSPVGALVVFEIKTASTSGKTGVAIEIGAVKIENGITTQTFHSLIKPDIKLSEKLQNALGIHEADYIRQPSAEQVIADFYLFAAHCDITAYPSAENFAVLSAAYKKLHFPFERFVDYAAFISDVGEMKNIKPSQDKSALDCAMAYAKKLV